MLQSLLRLQIYDEQIMTKTEELIATDQVLKIAQLTNYLWVLGKFKYSARNNAYLERAIQLILATENLDVVSACRNLWNLSALEYKSIAAMKHMTAVVMEQKDRLKDVDVANCVKSYATFEYLDYECLEMLLLQSIRTATEMKLFSLAVIVDSFAELDIRNPQLINISKLIIQQELLIAKGEAPEQLVTPYRLEILDAIIFQSAFCNGMFHEEEILYGLEELVMANMDDLDGNMIA